jgi:iron complex outermembrane receptor protein
MMNHETATLGYGDLDTQHFNFYVNVEYENDQPITVGQRGFPFNTNNLSSIGGENNIGGQPQLDNGSIYGSVAPTYGNDRRGTYLERRAPLPTGLVRRFWRQAVAVPKERSRRRPASGSYCTQNIELYQDDQPMTTRMGIYARATVDPNAHSRKYISTLSYFRYQDEFTGVPVPPGPAQIQAGSQTNTDSIVLPARLTGPGGPGTGMRSIPTTHSECAQVASKRFPAPTRSSTMRSATFRLSRRFPTTISAATLEAKGDFWGWTYDGAVTAAHSWVLLDIHGATQFPATRSRCERRRLQFPQSVVQHRSRSQLRCRRS